MRLDGRIHDHDRTLPEHIKAVLQGETDRYSRIGGQLSGTAQFGSKTVDERVGLASSSIDTRSPGYVEKSVACKSNIVELTFVIACGADFGNASPTTTATSSMLDPRQRCRGDRHYASG